MAKSKEEIQALVNEFLGKPQVPQVTEKEREAQCLAILDRLCGPGDETLIGFLFDVAQGQTGRDVHKPDGSLRTVYPNANERLAAARMLRVWHRGLAARSIKVDQTVTHRVKWDPNRLTLAELQALERTHDRASLPSGEIVEAQIVSDPEAAEESENLENPETEE